MPPQEASVRTKTQEMSREEKQIDGDVQGDRRDEGRPLSQTQYFQEDRGCRRLPTDTTVKSEAERGDTATLTARARVPIVIAKYILDSFFFRLRGLGPIIVLRNTLREGLSSRPNLCGGEP